MSQPMQFYSYMFFDTESSIKDLPKDVLEASKKEFVACIEANAHINTRSYATLALRQGSRFMLHMNAETPDAIQLFVRDLLHTSLGAHLRISYTLLGLRRTSQYAGKHSPKESDFHAAHRYLVVYPFTKTIEWHLMPFEERRGIMKAHVDVGRTFSDTISQMLLYAYGIDDHEFIVSYQMDSLEDFQTLVMSMRETESRRHTKNDLPIFTCISMSLEETLTMI
ncbi:chlorite dismutase family protein [soil metagenome]